MTLQELLDDCYARLNYPPSGTVEPKVTTRLTSFLNQTQTEILGSPSFKRLLSGSLTFTTVPGQWAYGLPSFIARIAAITDPTNQRRLGVMSSDQFRQQVPNPVVHHGVPVAYSFDAWSSVQQQPNPPGPVYVRSTFAGDDGSILQYSFVVRQGGVLSYGTSPAALNHLAPVLLANGLDVIALYDVFTYAEVNNLPVDIIQGPLATPTILTRIEPGHHRARSAQISLAPTPSGALPYTVFYEREIEGYAQMTNAGSEPLIPVRFHYIVAAGARMKEYELRGDTTRLAVAKREYDAGVAFLNAFVADQPDANDQMHPNDGRSGGYSVLGPWFPADSGYRTR